jgi:hypothetical protein
MQPASPPGTPGPAGPPGGLGSEGSTAHQPGQQRLVFRLVNTGGVALSNAELEIERQPGRLLRIPLRDDGMSQLDQPADGVLVGVDIGPYARLVQGRLWVDQPAGRTLAWEGVLSLPDQDSDGAAWTLLIQGGGVVARPVATLPAGDSVAGLAGAYPLAGVTFWAVFLLVYVGVLIALGRRTKPAPEPPTA